MVAFMSFGCASVAEKVVDPIQVKIPDVSIKKISLTTAVLNVTVQVTNPNKISATVSKLKYEIAIGDKQVASDVYVKDVKVPAKGTITEVVPVEVSNTDLVGFLAKVLLTKGTTYRARGDVYVGPLTIPFDERGPLTSKDL